MAATNPVLVSIQVGRPQTMGTPGGEHPFDDPWTSGIFKNAVSGPVQVRRTNLDGDEQADLRFHGGPDKAVCVYSADHYDAWRFELGLVEFRHGAFGENFTLRGVTEKDVCIGDRLLIGDAEFQVSQPRQPCWKLARKWRIKTLTAQVQKSGRTGWYLRVLEEGTVSPGDAVELLGRPLPKWTIAEANRVMFDKSAPPDDVAELASLPELSESWRETLASRLASPAGEASA